MVHRGVHEVLRGEDRRGGRQRGSQGQRGARGNLVVVGKEDLRAHWKVVVDPRGEVAVGPFHCGLMDLASHTRVVVREVHETRGYKHWRKGG